MPECVSRRLASMVVRVLGTGVDGVAGSHELYSPTGSDASWRVMDSTILRYRPGESQMPHIDPTDLTMLVYLSNSSGCTSFPKLNLRIKPAEGRLLVFFSTKPGATRHGEQAGCPWGQEIS